MPIVGTTKFLGYTSKPDFKVDDLGLGSRCENLIINKGDLCNHPYPIDDLSISSEQTTVIIFKASYLGAVPHIYFFENPRLNPADSIGVLNRSNLNGTGIQVFDDLNSLFSPWLNFFSPHKMNLFIFGDTIYILGDISEIGDNFIQDRQYRMLRSFEDPETPNDIIPSLMSIGQPSKAEWAGTDAHASDEALPAGTYSIACSFIFESEKGTDIDEGLSANWLKGLFSLESNATIWDSGEGDAIDGDIASLKAWRINVYLPTDIIGADIDSTYNMEEFFHSNLGTSKRIAIGVYAKLETETIWTYIGAYYPTSGIITDGDEHYVIITLADRVDSENDTEHFTSNTNLPAQFTGYSIRKRCSQMCYFRGRIYSNKFDEHELGNKLQISLLYNELFIRYQTFGHSLRDSEQLANNLPNYVDENLGTNIGPKGSVTGLIEFLGQLIIFKDDSTWVLTDDILVGELRKLFNVGCCNIKSGDAYCILNNILYFVDWTGIYAYTGDGHPIKISENITEELDEIDKERYSGCRLEADPKYNLVYLIFPHIDVNEFVKLKTYIFHPNEGGVWTKLLNSFSGYALDSSCSSLVLYEQDRYLNFPGKFLKLGDLNEPSNYDPINFVWISSLIEYPSSDYKKHWKELIFQQRFNNTEPMRFNIGSLAVRPDTVILSEIEDILSTHIGENSKDLKIILQTTTDQPFRINGFTLEAIVRGQR